MCERVRPSGNTTVSDLYRRAFLRNCHRWLAAGYALLDVASLSTAQEPAITGELVRAMKEARLQANAPTWMIRMYVADDPPVNAPGRLGRQRRRVDIEFERSERGITYQFHCEAKRLYRSDSVVEYLGSEGLGMFLAGEYACTENVGGMIGYVQSQSPDEWIGRLKVALTKGSAKYAVQREGELQPARLAPELPQIYQSTHERLAIGRPILVFHMFMLFVDFDSS